jgi:hypothetical protein
MMKNKYDDIILKYLAELLDKNERTRFEADLERDPDLKSRFEAVVRNFEEIKRLKPNNSDTGYFANVIPKVRERIDSGTYKFRFGTVQKVLASGLALIIILLVFLQYGEETNDYDLFSSTLAAADSVELNEFVELRFSDIELYDLVSEIDLETYAKAINEQLDNSEQLYGYSEYAYFGLGGLGEISESEEAEIYSSLIDKKIL